LLNSLTLFVKQLNRQLEEVYGKEIGIYYLLLDRWRYPDLPFILSTHRCHLACAVQPCPSSFCGKWRMDWQLCTFLKAY